MNEIIKCSDCGEELVLLNGVLYCNKCKQHYRLVLVKVQTPLDKILKVEVQYQ